MRPLHARRRGRGCCAESARSGQDRSLHGTRERRIVGRGGVVSVGPRLSVAKPGSEQCLPLRGKQPHERASFAGWRRSLCAAKRSCLLRGVCAAAYSHGRIWNPPLRCRGRCSSSTRKAVPYIGRGRGRGCRTEGSRSGQDRSLHGTRERRIVGRGLDPSGQPVSAAR